MGVAVDVNICSAYRRHKKRVICRRSCRRIMRLLKYSKCHCNTNSSVSNIRAINARIYEAAENRLHSPANETMQGRLIRHYSLKKGGTKMLVVRRSVTHAYAKKLDIYKNSSHLDGTWRSATYTTQQVRQDKKSTVNYLRRQDILLCKNMYARSV